jgi:hypothetical protein
MGSAATVHSSLLLSIIFLESMDGKLAKMGSTTKIPFAEIKKLLL